MNFAPAIYNGKPKIKNIIFDWGGVITNLHFDNTRKAFQDLGLDIFSESMVHDPNHKLFIPLEIGAITPDEFRNNIRNLFATPLSDSTIDEAWNAMLGDLPAERWSILEQVRKKYRTFILSNTNAIHVRYYFNRIQQKFGTYGYSHLFEKIYFSFELGLRKPDEAIFHYVLEDADLDPAETLFIDDFIENIQTARELGFQIIHLQAPLTLTDVFI